MYYNIIFCSVIQLEQQLEEIASVVNLVSEATAEEGELEVECEQTSKK